MLTQKASSVTFLLDATMNYDYHKKSFECTFDIILSSPILRAEAQQDLFICNLLQSDFQYK